MLNPPTSEASVFTLMIVATALVLPEAEATLAALRLTVRRWVVSPLNWPLTM